MPYRRPPGYTKARRAEQRDGEVPLKGHRKQERVMLGLELLSIYRTPGARFTYDEIAVWCGCTESAIYNAEKKALRKLANRLQFIKDPVLRDMVESVCRL